MEKNLTDQPCFHEDCDGLESTAYYVLPEPHLHCFKCGQQEWRLEKIEEYFTTMVALPEPNKYKGVSNTRIQTSGSISPNSPDTFTPSKGIIKALEDRRISKETAEKYKVETVYSMKEGDPAATTARAFPYYNTAGELVAQKVKKLDKQMKCLGLFSEALLFGQTIFPAGGKYVTITEGEEDAMAAYEMLKAQSFTKIEPAVVSIKSGAAAAKRDCQNNWEYLNSFETIIISFDNDAPGQKAAMEVADLFPNKVRVMKMDLKDSNEYLKESRASDYMTAWRLAEKHLPQGIVASSSLWKDMVTEDKSFNIPYPWNGLNDKLFGMRTGEFVVWKAPPKIGKTQIFRELTYHIHQTTEETIGLIYLEETKKKIGMGLCALDMNKPIQFPDCEYTLEELKSSYDKILGEDRFFIFDPMAERTAKNVFNKIMHFVKAYNCRFIFLDHVSMLAYDAVDVDERKFLDKLFKDLKDLTTSLDIHISAVTHVNDEGKTRGSRAAYQLCDALVDLSRDKLNDDPIVANTTVLTVEENRVTGDSGTACNLFFDRETGRMTELDPAMVLQRQTEQQLKTVKFED